MLPVLTCLALVVLVSAESGIDGWLRYARLPEFQDNSHHYTFPRNIQILNDTVGSPIHTAGYELQDGLQRLTGISVTVGFNSSSSIIVGTIDQYAATCNCDASRGSPDALMGDGFWLSAGTDEVLIMGHSERGTLYGTFEYLRNLAQGNFAPISEVHNPAAPIRAANQWDELSGRIGRGYGGPSIYLENGTFKQDLTRARQYARLLASIGINMLVVNDANAETDFLTAENIQGLGRVADAFRPWGVQLGLSLNFSSPVPIGGLSTYDPLDPGVVDFWNAITSEIYQSVPDFAGYLVKADSEDQPGPLQYNRTLSDGANLFANALKPYGGIVFYRAFIYNYYDESDWHNDRAKDAVDYFRGLDGKFEDNVVIQIKYGSLDFQVCEPPNALFAHLRRSNVIIEVEVTQEYLGQQNHLVYEAPLWKTIFDFDLRVDNKTSLISDIFTGKHFNRTLGGTAAVVNVGTNSTWLGSVMSMANMYAYGTLAWNPTADAEAILREWIHLTFGRDPHIVDTISKMSMQSWPAYLNITGNLGLNTLTDQYTHYAPCPECKDGNDLGLWTRADRNSIGIDRTAKNGSGADAQYPPQVFAQFEDVRTTPDALLLWFHHVNYTHVLHSGQTVIQHIYDAHYNGAETVHDWISMWKSLQGSIDPERYAEVLFHQEYQAGHALVWRDAIVGYYHNLSSIPDEQGRVGNHPYRIEAENMALDGYEVYGVVPFATASNNTAIVTHTNSTRGIAATTVDVPAGIYDLAVNYFDLADGVSRWELYLDDEMVLEWYGNNGDILGHAPSIYLDGTTNTRKTIQGVEMKGNEVLKIVGHPGGIEPAPLDYVSILPTGVWD